MDIHDLMTFIQSQFRKLLAAFNLFLVLLIPGVFSLAVSLSLPICIRGAGMGVAPVQ